MNNVNYMMEIIRIENSLEELEERATSKDQLTAVRRLKIMLDGLKQTADEMASYIRGDWSSETIESLRIHNNSALHQKDYITYSNNLSKILKAERVMLLCNSQTPDERAYFVSEYYKYKEKEAGRSIRKVL